MKTCANYITDAKRKLGNERLSDKALGQVLGYSQQAISCSKSGTMTDPVAVAIAKFLGVPAGEVLMVARMEREKDPEVRAALMAHAASMSEWLEAREIAAKLKANDKLAEAVRFELTEDLNPRRFSRPVP